MKATMKSARIFNIKKALSFSSIDEASKSLSLVSLLKTASRPCLLKSGRFYSSSLTNLHEYPTGPETLSVKFIRKDMTELVTPAAIGANIMRVAQRHGIELEGACEGVCACSTCHVILDRKIYESLPEASEKEEDMLDQAFGLTPTSRLGCQVILTPELNNITIKLPKATRNFYVDGHVPKPH